MTGLRYLFDTHVCLHLIRHGAGELAALFEQCTPGEIAISSLTLAALRARAQNSRAPEQNRRALEQFVLPLLVVNFDVDSAAWLGRLAAEVETQGRAAGPNEMIAAQALRFGAQLVTNQPSLYAGIAELRVFPVFDRSAAPVQSGSPASMLASVPASSAVGVRPPAPHAAAARLIQMAGSHDFTLDLLAAWLHAGDPQLTLALDSVGSLRGLLALQQGMAQLAGSHLLDEETGDYNRSYIQHLLTPLGVRVVLLGFVEREQGLIVAHGNPKNIRSLQDVARPDVTFINRQRGAGTRVLLDHHLAREGIPATEVRGYDRQEPTHTAVAAAVVEGAADCGLGVLAAARALGLDFVPLFHERFDLVIPVEHYAGALLQPLLAVLRRPDAGFMQEVAALGGYATDLMGKVLAEL